MFKIDLLDTNYEDTFLRKDKKRKKLLYNLLNLLYDSLAHFYNDLLYFLKKKNIKHKVLFFYTTINQKNALYPVYLQIDDSIFIGNSKKHQYRLPRSPGYILSFILSPIFFFRLNTVYKNHRNKILSHFEKYFTIQGVFIWWSFYLKYLKPQGIVLANDHTIWHRLLRKAAQNNKIPVIYIQHASVSEKFPKLEFDLSLLEGEDAYNKYKGKGIEKTVKFIGMPKFDRYYDKQNKNNRLKTIGICLSIFDEKVKIEKLIYNLRAILKSEQIIVRPHPGDNGDEFLSKLCTKYNLKLSNSKVEDSFTYLSNVDVNIADDTSVHLEAALINVYPVYIPLNDNWKDIYGYVENELIMDSYTLNDFDELAKKIMELQYVKPNVRSRAKYYVDTVETEYDGHSSVLAQEYIQQFLSR